MEVQKTNKVNTEVEEHSQGSEKVVYLAQYWLLRDFLEQTQAYPLYIEKYSFRNEDGHYYEACK